MGKHKHKKSSKSKKKKERRRSSSSESDTNDEYSSRSSSRSDKDRVKVEERKQKELIKAYETPEEKRARRLAKKEEKDRKRREKMGWDKEYMGYTNADNPFGDGKLLDTFVWHKKLEEDGLNHLAPNQKKSLMKMKQEANKIELAKVKQQRQERERERQQRDADTEMMQREKEAEHFKVWEDQEDKFHLEQAKLRSRIRIKDGRAKPIDLLAKYAISAADGAEDLSGLEMHEPYTYLNGLTMTDLEDLLEDIKVYIELEEGKNVDFWKDMTTITEDELRTLKKIAADEEGHTSRDSRREGMNKAVADDVTHLFKNKTFNQLLALQRKIKQKLQSGGGTTTIDVSYWESLVAPLRAYLARARLRERHQELLRIRLYKLKMEQMGEERAVFPAAKTIAKVEPSSTSTDNPTTSRPDESRVEVDDVTNDVTKEDKEVELSLEDIELNAEKEYRDGNYSPRLIEVTSLPPDTVIVDAHESMMTIEGRRRLLSKTGESKGSNEDAFMRRAREGMDNEEEATFAVEAPIANQVFLWADKYRPRKPRFFNRVHTGFEWNKYNQTHYDFDNPPPKIVQGYKFNIFYPDLIDKTQTPQYTLTPDGSTDFAILRFTTGPPYQDLAFKIVNREWEYSHKHGFRCQFINSIFQLWFHFKRYRYRR